MMQPIFGNFNAKQHASLPCLAKAQDVCCDGHL